MVELHNCRGHRWFNGKKKEGGEEGRGEEGRVGVDERGRGKTDEECTRHDGR